MTATQLQFRRGTAAQMATFTGAPGEVVVDTSNNRVVVHDGTTAGGWPAARIAELAPQCGRLSYVSATQIKFAPFNGGSVKIAGLLYAIPSAGVTTANTSVYVNGTAGQNLAASTLYYVYLFNNAGTLTVDFSATGHAADTTTANVGVEIKSGDNSRTLIGMIFTNASSQFSDAPATRFVASWFNRRNRDAASVALSGATTTSVNVFVEISNSSSGRMALISWGDEAICITMLGQVVNSALGNTDYINFGDNSTATIANNGAMFVNSASAGYNDFTASAYTPSEGFHNYFQLACEASPGTATFYTQLFAVVRQ
jgi:hypothetical protein